MATVCSAETCTGALAWIELVSKESRAAHNVVIEAQILLGATGA